MAAEILTREDLAIFKTELFRELRELVNAPAIQPRKWLKSYEVRDLLGISPGTSKTCVSTVRWPLPKLAA